MQKTQVDSVLPVLFRNHSCNIVFVVNTASGYEDWVNSVGADGKLMLGFPSAGGECVNGKVNYFVGSGILHIFQTTTFGEYSGKRTERLIKLVEAFVDAGIPTVPNKEADQVSNVTPTGFFHSLIK